MSAFGTKQTFTISKSDNMVKMMWLADFKMVQENAGKQYMSTKKQHEYDCKKDKYRIIFLITYSENMGEGNIVNTYVEPQKWVTVVSDSVGEVMWKYACGK
jgi:hypothetical protein